MKKAIKILLVFIVALVTFVSCEDSDAVRVPEIDKVVSMRLQLDPDYLFLDALDIPNAILKMSLFTEVSTIEKVELKLTYYSFTQDSLYDDVLVHVFSGSDFSSSGIISDFDLPAITISDSVGIAIADMDGGDRLDFTIFTFIKSANGQMTMFPDTIPGLDGVLNTTPNILNSSGTTSLTTSFTSYVACPVPDGYLTGNYHWKQISGPSDPFFGTGDMIPETDVNISASSPIGREFGNLSYATFGGGTFNLLLVCNNVLVPYTSAPASCGGGLGWIGDNANIYVYSDDDDSEITLNLLHNPTEDCGLPLNEPWVIKLTKL